MPNVDLILGADPGRKRSVRTEPTQRRSTQRLDALLDAAAEIVDETGFERLTTADGRRAGRRVDRHRLPVLPRPRRRAARAPRARRSAAYPRALSPTTSSASELPTGGTSSTSRSTRSRRCTAMSPASPSCTPADARPATATASPSSRTGWRSLIEAEFDRGDELDAAELALPPRASAIELGDALISRAFERDPAGDERYLAEAKRLVHDYLAEHLGEARSRPPPPEAAGIPQRDRLSSRLPLSPEWCLACVRTRDRPRAGSEAAHDRVPRRHEAVPRRHASRSTDFSLVIPPRKTTVLVGSSGSRQDDPAAHDQPHGRADLAATIEIDGESIATRDPGAAAPRHRLRHAELRPAAALHA